LRKKAHDAGVANHEIDEVLEPLIRPKADLIELIIKREVVNAGGALD